MFRRLGSHVRSQWAGFLSLFLVLTGGVAYAAGEWTGANIVDGSLTTADYRNNDIRSGDVLDDSLNSADIKNFSLGNGDLLTGSVDSRAATDNSLTSVDIKNFSLGNGDLLTGSVDSRAATDNSLTGADVAQNSLAGSDIDESTLVGVNDGNSCISGAALYGRLCAGSDGGNRTLTAAFNFCASIDLRLPTWGEAVLLAVNHNVPGVGAHPDFFWTDEVAGELEPENNFSVLIVNEDGNADAVGMTNALKTVCVTNPD